MILIKENKNVNSDKSWKWSQFIVGNIDKWTATSAFLDVVILSIVCLSERQIVDFYTEFFSISWDSWQKSRFPLCYELEQANSQWETSKHRYFALSNLHTFTIKKREKSSLLLHMWKMTNLYYQISLQIVCPF